MCIPLKVAAAIELVVDEERINYAEINEKEELYGLADKVNLKQLERLIERNGTTSRCTADNIKKRLNIMLKASYKLGGVRDELLRDSLLSVMERARTKAVEDQSNWMKRHLENLIK